MPPCSSLPPPMAMNECLEVLQWRSAKCYMYPQLVEEAMHCCTQNAVTFKHANTNWPGEFFGFSPLFKLILYIEQGCAIYILIPRC